MSKEEDYFNKVLKRQLEGMGLSPSEVEKGLQEAYDFTDGLDEVFDEMFPEPPKGDPTDLPEPPPNGAIL